MRTSTSDRQLVVGEAANGERNLGLAPHGVDIRQRVGGCDGPEALGLVDDGRDEVHGEDERRAGLRAQAAPHPPWTPTLIRRPRDDRREPPVFRTWTRPSAEKLAGSTARGYERCQVGRHSPVLPMDAREGMLVKARLVGNALAPEREDRTVIPLREPRTLRVLEAMRNVPDIQDLRGLPHLRRMTPQ